MNTGTAAPETLFGYDVLDSNGNKIGTVDSVWVDDATNETEFIGVTTGWLFGKTHVIPTASAQFGGNSVTVPYGEDQIKDAPSFSADDELSPEQEDDIYSYYGINRSTAASPSGLPAGGTGQQYETTSTANVDTADYTPTANVDTADYTPTADTGDRADITLSEEELQVGKREVEAGRVRLRKVVHTEHQEVPVDLRREEVEIERVPASNAGAPADAFEETEVEVPVMQEEPVVAKEAHVTGGVQLNKGTTTETRSVGGDVRKEDVEIDRDVETETAPTDRTY